MDSAAAKAAFKAGRNAIEMELGEVRAERDAALEALEEAQAQISRMVDGGSCPARDPNGECVELNTAISERDEAQGKLEAVETLASEAVCPDCIRKMDEACVDEGCNWSRQALRILRSKEDE